MGSDRTARVASTATAVLAVAATSAPLAMTAALATGATGARYLDPAWSPDGNRIAFVKYAPHTSAKSAIYLMTRDGTGLRRLTGTRKATPAQQPLVPKITGGTRAQHAVLRLIVHSMRNHRIVAIRIGPASKGSRSPGTLWLNFKIRLASGLEYTQGVWHAYVVEGLFAAESAMRGWRRVTGGSHTLLLPGGREKFDGSDAFSLAPVDAAPPEHVLRSEVAAALRSSPLTLRSVSFERPLGQVSVRVVATAAHPHQFLKTSRDTIMSVIQPLTRPPNGAPALVEGALVEIYDTKGRWVDATGFSARTSLGVGVTNPLFK